jgi:hypothetical protein
MNEDYTHIDFLLDRTGSMQEIKADVIGGANAFIKDQQDEPGKCTMSLTQFDTQDAQEVMFDFALIEKAPLLNDQNYMPRAGTPLVYAMIRRIQELSKTLSEMDEEDRPAKVIFVVYTDGEENQSYTFEDDRSKPIYTDKALKELVEKQTEDSGWIFTFLGADQDAFQAGASYGIGIGTTMSVGKTGIGTQCAFMSTSRHVKAARMSRSGVDAATAMSYTEQERGVQAEELAKSGKGHIKDEVPSAC